MGLLASAQADKIARQYRWLNFHPKATIEAVAHWFSDSQLKFREHQQVYPLALKGEPSSGKRYLLEAAHFQQTRNGLPVVIFHWDMELWDAPTQQAQIEHMQAKLENFEQQLAMQNPSLWAKLGMLLKNAESATVPVAGGEINLNLKGIWNLLFPPPRNETERADSTDSFAPVIAQFRELLRDSHVILHVRRAELLDWGLLEKLRHTVKWLNTDAEMGSGFMALAFSFPPTFPLHGLLGTPERYATLSLTAFSANSVLLALRETYDESVADAPFAAWLLQHAALHGNGAMDAAHLGKLLDKLLDEGLLTSIDGQWQFAPLDALERWKTVLGKNLEQQWIERTEHVPTAQRQTLHALFALAALGGEWIPVGVLLDYLGIRDIDQRDDLIDLLDDLYGKSPALLHCMNYQFAGMGSKMLVYRFASPLLPLLLREPATSKQQATKLLKSLQQRWTNPTRNQAAYLLRLAEHADPTLGHALREQLAWQVEIEFANELQEHLFQQLIHHELSIDTLHRIMAKHHAIWVMPRRRAICRAWFNFYQHSLHDVSEQVIYAGQAWEELWGSPAVDDLPIPATEDGLNLCFYYGYAERDAGKIEFAERIFRVGLMLCQKYPNSAMQARFHGGVADIL